MRQLSQRLVCLVSFQFSYSQQIRIHYALVTLAKIEAFSPILTHRSRHLDLPQQQFKTTTLLILGSDDYTCLTSKVLIKSFILFGIRLVGVNRKLRRQFHGACLTMR